MKTNPGIEAVRTLASLGYQFTLAGETIKAKYYGNGKPDPDTVRALLETVKAHKPDVLTYLSKPAPQERILTCADCHNFEPNNGSNPRQGWGKCLKRARGRFGCATACAEAFSQEEASHAYPQH